MSFVFKFGSNWTIFDVSTRCSYMGLVYCLCARCARDGVGSDICTSLRRRPSAPGRTTPSHLSRDLSVCQSVSLSLGDQCWPLLQFLSSSCCGSLDGGQQSGAQPLPALPLTATLSSRSGERMLGWSSQSSLPQVVSQRTPHILLGTANASYPVTVLSRIMHSVHQDPRAILPNREQASAASASM